MITPPLTPASPPTPKKQHLTRLLSIWRSDGWPSKDALEIELLVEGWVCMKNEAGHERLRLTESVRAHLAASRQRNQRAISTHDRLAEQVAGQLHDAGRLVWKELSLRARAGAEPSPKQPPQALDLFGPDAEGGGPPAPSVADPAPPTTTFEPVVGGWRMARPDVFSVRNTSVEVYLHPVVHEIKVSRADLFSDLRHAAKRAAYQWLCCECHYVFPAGMAQPEELPPELGVWVIHGDIETGRMEQLRPARHTPCTLPFAVWLALAKATPWTPERDARQMHLGQPDGLLPGMAADAALPVQGKADTR